MTTQELMVKVYEESGEPTDRCPYTDPSDPATFSMATPGAVRLLRALNTAQRRVASWRFRNNRLLRFRCLFGKSFFVSKDPPTGTVSSATDTTATLEALGADVDDEMNGWILEITDGTGSGQTRLIVDTAITGGVPVVEIESAWDTNPDATSEYALYKNYFDFVPVATPATYLGYHIELDPVNTLMDVVKVRDVTSGADLDRTSKEEFFSGSLTSKGVPTEYKVFGNRLIMDSAPDGRRVYEIFYVRHPAELTDADQVPELPVTFHEAISLWSVHEIQRLNQGLEAAYATKRELEDLMEMLALQGMREGEFDMGSWLVYG